MARRELHRLSARAALTETKPGRHADGGNLYLSINPKGGRRWTFLYRERGTSRLREMGLGPAAGPKKGGLCLADARRKAEEARRLLYNGTDPIVAKRAAAPIKTFGEFADELVKSLKSGFKSEIHAKQWETTLKVDAATLRPIQLKDVTTEDVLRVLKPIWETKHETASRLRGRIERVMDAAKAKGLRTGDNPARWRGNLKELLPNRKKSERAHHTAVPHEEVPQLIADLRQRRSVSALALEFTILTAARTGEVLGATWAEIDLERRLWIIPAGRMKAAREHIVPLSDRTIEIIGSLLIPGAKPRPSDRLFPSARRGVPLSNMAMLEMLRGTLGKNATVHGFRSSFRDWCGDETSFPRDVIEFALAHGINDKTEEAYRRKTAIEKRRKLMEAWAAYCASPKTGKVVAFRR
jgi:integrase